MQIGDDILDTRDIDDRIEELEELEEEVEELIQLKELRSDLADYCDWDHGETLIHESHQIEYAQQLADDIGAINPTPNWPNNHIDWEAAAEELFTHDYISSEIGRHTYHVRCS